MLIKIADIGEEGLDLDISDESQFPELLEGIDIHPVGKVTGNLRLDKVKGALSVKGHLKASFCIHCSRCLSDIKEDVDTDFKSTLFIKEVDTNLEGHESEIDSTEIGSDYIASSSIDTNDFFIEQLALKIPLQPLCSEGCKGLCSNCGTNLNEKSCDCKTEEPIDPRFAKLKDFKVK